MTKGQSSKKNEYRENKTSWKWFKLRIEKYFGIYAELNDRNHLTMLMILEILKEFQQLNMRRK